MKFTLAITVNTLNLKPYKKKKRSLIFNKKI